MMSSTSPSWFARSGGAGKAASTARTTVDRWSERATVGNGPEARFSPRNQIARISAPAASADPPTESAVFSRVARVRRRSRIPNTDPTASPIAPISSTVPSAAAAFAGSDSNRPATCGASHADHEADHEAAEPGDLEDRSSSVAAPRRQPQQREEDHVEEVTDVIVPRPRDREVSRRDAHLDCRRGHDRPHLRPARRLAPFRSQHAPSGDRELNELRPTAVICSGDLTTDGFRQEYQAWLSYAERIEAPLLTIPGTTTRGTSDTSTSRS